MIKVLRRYIVGLFIITLTFILGCEPAQIEVSEIEFFIAKEWKIESVFVNGEEVTDTDLSHYRLKLEDDFTFSRITIDGQEESGDWQLTSGLTQIVLFVNDPREERYLLLNLEIRRLELRLLQDSFKDGELDIRYILIPVKE